MAGRYEDYASFGSTTLGKFQVRFKATDWLALAVPAWAGIIAPSSLFFASPTRLLVTPGLYEFDTSTSAADAGSRAR